MKGNILAIFMMMAAWIACQGRQYAVADIPNVQLSDSTRLLSNPDGIVSAATAAEIDRLLTDIRRRTGAEVAAVVVDDIDSDDIDGYATELFTEWGIGDKTGDTGALILVAKDRRKAVIRTGYGIEGVLPDILAGRTLNDIMFPEFKNGDYDQGMLLGVKEIHRITTEPGAADELLSQIKAKEDAELKSGIMSYLTAGACAAGVLLIVLVVYVMSLGKKDDSEKYRATDRLNLFVWVLTILFLGVPLLVAVPFTLLRRHWRDHARKCPRCGTKMHKLDEVTDNRYLSTGQDAEERVKSVDYDVWLCPKCGDTLVYAYENTHSSYTRCPYCHAKTMATLSDTVVSQPTQRSTGVGRRVKQCAHCQRTQTSDYIIPKLAAPVVVGGISGGRGGGFGGGFGGGGFGGGSTGGGGASGGW